VTRPRVDVELWVWPLGAEPAGDGLADCLSQDELLRARSFATAELRNRWVRARAGMRHILASRLDVPAGALSFAVGPQGKPSLAKIDCPFFFNLSHSEDLAVLAISEATLGVDIERIGGLHEGVAEAFFSADENRALAAMPSEDRVRAFYRCWTAKEAVLKALGTGLLSEGKSFTVGFDTGDTLQLLQADWQETTIEDWCLAGFDPLPGFTGAVAVKAGGVQRIALKEWNFNSV
jgi:4'-phosphopantetheinyl transferase